MPEVSNDHREQGKDDDAKNHQGKILLYNGNVSKKIANGCKAYNP